MKSKKSIDKKLSCFETKEEIVFYLQNVLKNEILKDEKKIREGFNKIKCANCGVCCRLSISEFPPETLLKKAKNGDKTAKSFLRVFEIYKDNNLPKDLIQYIPENLMDAKQREGAYFYHCKKVKLKDGKYFCPEYNERPDVCRNFPDTPLENLPESCAYNVWKDENQVRAMFIKALNEIRKSYLDSLLKEG